ncbi:MAG: Inositol-1-monophosphatase [Bacteroidia bacterium]|nr:Inositol-1-monophosphatase [Bacteroidia bacterium]
MNYQHLCTQVCTLAKETGAFIKEEGKRFKTSTVEVKGHNNFVSYVDKTSEQKLVTALSTLLPEAGFIAEEGTSDKKGERYNWIIDPLDGTTNFIHGFPCYAISIALTAPLPPEGGGSNALSVEGKWADKSPLRGVGGLNCGVVLGVVYEINQDELFYAWKDSDAYMNGNKITVSDTPTLKDSLLGTGFPYYDYGKMDEYLKLFRHFMQYSHGLRRPGSAATDLAYLACGRFDGFYEYSLAPWDVAAGAFLVERAGGKVADFSGGDNYLFGKEIVAANALVFQELQETVKEFMK